MTAVGLVLFFIGLVAAHLWPNDYWYFDWRDVIGPLVGPLTCFAGLALIVAGVARLLWEVAP